MKKILFVDDDQDVLSISSMLIKSLGHEILLVNSGEEAINLIRNSESNIDFIFLDLMMPGIDGFDVLTFMKDANIHIPTVIQTGIIDEGDLKRIKELGAVDYITKPYTKEDLRRAITKMSEFIANDPYNKN